MARDMSPEAVAPTGDDLSPDQVRARWLTELRRQGHRQCYGDYAIGGNVCAIGLLAEVVGLTTYADDIGNFAVLVGLTEEQMREVVDRNDGVECDQHTFAEIADVVESWFQ